jgi:alpha-N-arabinofuranosidase
MRKTSVLSLMVMVSVALFAQQKSVIRVYPDKGEQVIHKEIYGQFAEHLGRCIYGGIWVGEDSPIPNINGYRKDVFEALKELQVPVIRWRAGALPTNIIGWTAIGPREQRPNW